MIRGTSISTSVRRYFIDDFFFSQSYLIHPEHKVMDVGGKKINKRGHFNIDSYGAKVTYVNIDATMQPDILADAKAIPVPDNSFDIVIMGEILEHVPDPRPVMKEAHRLLKPGGKLIATIPFMIPVHADPYDYGRYTDTFWKENSKDLGFNSIEVHNHGKMYAVLGYMMQQFFNAHKSSYILRKIKRLVEMPFLYVLLRIDKKSENKLIKAWTTGYGIILTK